MKDISTTNLLNILEQNQITAENLSDYVSEAKDTYPNRNIFSDYIAQNSEGITTARIIRNCSGYLSRSYAYDIFNGTTAKHPSRDVILVLCLSAHMDRRMIRRTLEAFQHRELYLKDPRDLIIATYVNNRNYNIEAINSELYEYRLPLLMAD